MPATDSRKVRSVERPRKNGRAANIAATAGTARRSTSRKLGRLSVVKAEPSVAGGLSGTEQTSGGDSRPDLAARLLTATPAKTLVQLTPGQMVRITREFADLSQIELALRAGLTQATVSAIETGKVALGVTRAKRLAEALRVHPAALLFPTQ